MKTFLAVAALLAVASADGNFGAFGGSTGNNLGGYSSGGSTGGYSGGGSSGSSFGGAFSSGSSLGGSGFGGSSGSSGFIGSSGNSGFVGSSGNSGFSSGNAAIEGGNAGGQVFRHVSVHIAPEDPTDHQSKVLRIPGGDKHVNIIFVKTPSSSSSAQTEVILPEQNQQKNLVYVLLKKPEASDNIRIRRPGPAQPTKPEVYFIRYKNGAGAAGAAGVATGAGASTGTGGAIATFGNTGSTGGIGFSGNTGAISTPSAAYGSP